MLPSRPPQVEPLGLLVIELELTTHLDEDAVSNLSCHFPFPCDYDGEGTRGTKFVF